MAARFAHPQCQRVPIHTQKREKKTKAHAAGEAGTAQPPIPEPPILAPQAPRTSSICRKGE